MAQKALSDAVLAQTVAAIKAAGGNVVQAAKASGVPRATFESRAHRAAGLGLIDLDALRAGKAQASAQAAADTFSTTGNEATVSRVTPERVKSLADLIRVCEIDTAEWDVERYVCNKWETSAKVGPQDTAEVKVTELYQVKAWLKRKVALLAARAEVEALLAEARQGLPTIKAVAPKAPKSGFMLELNIADLHNGKLAWSGETGHDPYDTKIAEALHDAAVEALLQRTSAYRFDEIVLAVGNDLLHVDSRSNQTTAGTPQDTDSRYYKVFLSTRRMTQRAIERCRKLARVRVVMVPGNHDRDSVWHLGDSLACVYDGCKDVVINNAPTQRKYVEFGKVMLMLTHGDKGKRADYPLLMATEQAAMFGRTQFREAHTGHLHQTQVQEWHGVRVRILPSLAGVDAWHAENTYTGNIRAAEAFIWSASEGLVGTAYYTVPAGKVAA